MRTDDQSQPGPARYLIVSSQPHKRRLLADALRGGRRCVVDQVEIHAQCLKALADSDPEVLFVDWHASNGEGLTLVRQLRAGAAGEAMKQIPIVMVSSRNQVRHVQAARNAGIDEFLLFPFSTKALFARIDSVRRRRREFVESVTYVGPCRRRHASDRYEGPPRRLGDMRDAGEDSLDMTVKKGLARMYAERISALLGDAASGDPTAVRTFYIACLQLRTLAADLGEPLLLTASDSLLHYTRGVGASGSLNADVVRAHLDALVQLAELPNAKGEIRQAVTGALSALVAKKLRVADAQTLRTA